MDKDKEVTLNEVDNKIFGILNGILDVSDICLLIIDYYQCFTWSKKKTPSNCRIDNDGHRMCCFSGSTGEWEHVVGNEGGKYLDFKVKLDNINNGGNNVCIGIISKPVIANTSGGWYNGNGTVIAFGCEYFKGNGMAQNGHGFIRLKGGRWRKGDIISVTADSSNSTIRYEWGSGDTKRVESHTFVQSSTDIYPVICIWYQNDTVSFVA